MGKVVLAISALSLVFGLLILVVPQSLMSMSEVFNRMVVRVDNQVFKYHIGIGVCLILAAIFLFAYGTTMGWR
jgi:hypothetical protein